MESTTRKGRWASALAVVALLAAAVGSSHGALAAQQPDPQERTECRCVDRDGNEIENCRCLRTFSLEPTVATGMFARRAMIGVIISVSQDDEVDRQGARIEQVRDGSPADEAGLEAGDVVVAVGGRSVFDALEDRDVERRLDLDQSVPVQRFQRLVAGLEPDEPVEFEILRDGRRRTVTVTPERATGVSVFGLDDGVEVRLQGLREGTERMRGELEALARGERWRQEGPGVYRFRLPEGEGRAWSLELDSLRLAEPFGRTGDPCFAVGSSSGSVRGNVWVMGFRSCVGGVEFVDVNPELGEYFGSDPRALAAEVAEGSTLGLRAGDVVLAIDGREVEDAEQALRILRSYDADEEMRIRILRRGEEIEVLGRRR